ncbi:TPA: hypothetical protein ACH3X1_015824 [Trebouxia sp. C0004]
MQSFLLTATLALTCCQLCQGASTKGVQASSRKILDTCGTSDYGQCGGLSCPGPWQCADAAVGCCPSGYSCSRQSAYYWQCLPGAATSSSPTATSAPTPSPTPSSTPSPTPATTSAATAVATTSPASTPWLNICNGLVLSEYAQCGGESNCPSGVTCSDNQWPIGCCPTGDSCTRSSASYWQCLPGTPSPPALQVAAGTYLSGKTALFPDSEGGLTGFTPLDPVLPSQNWTVTGTGQPSDCYYDTDDCEGADASTWQTIWKVTYPDNPSTSVTLCVCNTASITPKDLAHYVGKVPVFLRTTVSAYNAVSGGGSAYTVGGTVTLQGDCQMDVFVHESTHAFDGMYSLSGSSAYLQALYQDSCLPDEYAMNNNVECFAQDMVVFVYYLWDPNFLQNVCMEYEIFYIAQLTVPGVQAYKTMVAATLAAAPPASPAATSAATPVATVVATPSATTHCNGTLQGSGNKLQCIPATPAATVVVTPSATPHCNGTLQGSGNKLQCIPATPAATVVATPATTVKATPAPTVKATPAATSAATVKATPAATSAATIKATPAATTATKTCSTSLGQYAQCGGQSNCPSASMCGDMQWWVNSICY